MEISLNSKGSKNVVEITGLPSGTSYEEKRTEIRTTDRPPR